MLGGGKRGGDYAARNTLQPRYGLGDLQGESPQMEQTRRTIMLYARSPAAVLIEGETGTGKELAAQALHREYFSRRGAPARGATPPFVPSTAAPSPNRCWRRSCSAMRKAPLPAHGAAADAGCWKPPTVAPCFWMRSAKCRCTCKPGPARAGRNHHPGRRAAAGGGRLSRHQRHPQPPEQAIQRGDFAPICSTA